MVMNDVNRSLSELCVTKHPTLLEVSISCGREEGEGREEAGDRSGVHRYQRASGSASGIMGRIHDPRCVREWALSLDAYSVSRLRLGQGLWNALADIIKLSECEVFSYLPDMESDPFSEGNIWSFNYFFVNKQLKRIVYLTCMAKR